MFEWPLLQFHIKEIDIQTDPKCPQTKNTKFRSWIPSRPQTKTTKLVLAKVRSKYLPSTGFLLLLSHFDISSYFFVCLDISLYCLLFGYFFECFSFFLYVWILDTVCMFGYFFVLFLLDFLYVLTFLRI